MLWKFSLYLSGYNLARKKAQHRWQLHTSLENNVRFIPNTISKCCAGPSAFHCLAGLLSVTLTCWHTDANGIRVWYQDTEENRLFTNTRLSARLARCIASVFQIVSCKINRSKCYSNSKLSPRCKSSATYQGLCRFFKYTKTLEGKMPTR